MWLIFLLVVMMFLVIVRLVSSRVVVVWVMFELVSWVILISCLDMWLRLLWNVLCMG